MVKQPFIPVKIDMDMILEKIDHDDYNIDDIASYTRNN